MSLYGEDRWKDLIGKRIRSARNEGDCFFVDFDDGQTAKFGVFGDCCSHSWIEHLAVPSDVEGATLLSVEDSGGIEHEDPDHGCLQVYQTHFRTDRGDITLEYRNSSNGYYGGYLERIS